MEKDPFPETPFDPAKEEKEIEMMAKKLKAFDPVPKTTFTNDEVIALLTEVSGNVLDADVMVRAATANLIRSMKILTVLSRDALNKKALGEIK